MVIRIIAGGQLNIQYCILITYARRKINQAIKRAAAAPFMFARERCADFLALLW